MVFPESDYYKTFLIFCLSSREREIPVPSHITHTKFCMSEIVTQELFCLRILLQFFHSKKVSNGKCSYKFFIYMYKYLKIPNFYLV